ncbi:hypothetical protein ABZZ17_13350 [Streptomyces sp. NPDC006512]|uniref:hypothetical protein n=1 Tax=Streptomyces sp. NPDC006512 TaxID=3154307 RepID=UPI0033A29E4A
MATILSRARWQSAWLGAVFVATWVTGCGWAGGGAGEGTAPERVAAADICHGLFRGRAEGALRKALRTEDFSHSTDLDSVPAAASLLREDPVPSPFGAGERRICTVYVYEETNIAELTVGAERVTPEIADARHTRMRYRLGRTAWANENKGVVYVDCLTPRLRGERPAVLAVSAWNRTFPSGDVAAYRDAHLYLAHAAAVAFVRELGCQGDAGLPDRLPDRLAVLEDPGR